jgi:hypothetical protein
MKIALVSFILLGFAKLPGQQDQYIKATGQAYTSPYDYQSIMHYPRSAEM